MLLPTDVRPEIQEVIAECLPLLKALGKGRCVVTIGGSHGKGLQDDRSDLDFRVFCDEIVSQMWQTDSWIAFCNIVEKYKVQNIHIDYCWVRTIEEIETQLNNWLSGKAHPEARVWSVWGYHFLTDIANQMVIDDPSGIIAGWHDRLAHYPKELKDSLIRKHMGSLNYWRSDYHYRNKVERGDLVFLAGLTSRLIYDMMEVIYALNEFYYPGDGNNLRYTKDFALKPVNFEERICDILNPSCGEDRLEKQYQMIMDLIDDIQPLTT